MSDDVAITRPVKIESDSPQRVALDLMRHIADFEDTGEKDKRYWFGLYSQCLKATYGQSLESIMKEE